jgi:hypothetical protein
MLNTPDTHTGLTSSIEPQTDMAATAPPPENKQAILVKSISDEVVGRVAERLAPTLIDIAATLGSVMARLDAIGLGSDKRPPKAERKAAPAGGAKAAGKGAVGGAKPKASINNGLNFTRHMWEKPEFSDELNTEEFQDWIDADATRRAKIDKAAADKKDAATGALYWAYTAEAGNTELRSHLTQAFKDWKDASEKAAIAPPLTADGDGADDEGDDLIE